MTIRPRLNVICGRCGKRREGLRHVCVTSSGRASRRRATIKLQPVLGGCARCGKQYGGRNGNPLTHVCRPRDGDFRSRRTAHQRKIRSAARARVRAAARDKQRAKVAAVRDRERERSRIRVARLKASYELRLAAERAKTGTAHKSPDKPAPRPRRPPHDYQACADKDCMRSVCVAFKEGYKTGHQDGYKQGFERGWEQGYAKGYAEGFGAGFSEGLRSCPGPHGG